MENRKNTILLTVIAVATLLVAVVGATFAFFTASGGSASEGKVTVSTGTAGSSEFGTLKAINIYADATTFNEAAGGTESGLREHTDNSTGTVSWTAPGASGTATPSEADRSFCYTATLAVDSNTFVKSAANTTGATELEFTAVKTPAGGEATTLIDKMDITTTKAAVKIPTTAGGTEYTHKLIPDAGKTLSDSWTLTVTLVNLGVNQNDNAGKQFSGAIKFDKVAC